MNPCFGLRIQIVWLQKISTPTASKVIGNSEGKGEGGGESAKVKESMELNWKFMGGGGVQIKKTFGTGGIDIFWNPPLL